MDQTDSEMEFIEDAKASPNKDDVTRSDVMTDLIRDKTSSAVRDSVTVEMGGTVQKVPPPISPKVPPPTAPKPGPRSPGPEAARAHSSQLADNASYQLIKDRTRLSMRKDQDLFVETSAYRAGLGELQGLGFVLLTGPALSGKTTLAYALLRHYQTQGFTPITIQKYEELQSQVGGERKMAVFLEDVMEPPTAAAGRQSSLRPPDSDSTAWLPILPIMQRAARRESRVIIATVSEATARCHSGDEKFCNMLDTALDLASEQYRLTRDERQLILHKQLQRARLEASQEAVEEILAVSDSISSALFLSQCKQFSESNLPDKQRLEHFTKGPVHPPSLTNDVSQPQNHLSLGEFKATPNNSQTFLENGADKFRKTDANNVHKESNTLMDPSCRVTETSKTLPHSANTVMEPSSRTTQTSKTLTCSASETAVFSSGNTVEIGVIPSGSVNEAGAIPSCHTNETGENSSLSTTETGAGLTGTARGPFKDTSVSATETATAHITSSGAEICEDRPAAGLCSPPCSLPNIQPESPNVTLPSSIIETPSMVIAEEPKTPEKEDFQLSVITDDQLIFCVPNELAKRILSNSTRKVGTKGAMFKGLLDINKILSESNWTTEGVIYYLPKTVQCSVSDAGEIQEQKPGTETVKGGTRNPVQDVSSCHLHESCKRNEIEVVKALVKRGVDLAAKDEFGFTALHVACLLGHVDIAHILLDGKCPIDLTDKKGWTPFHLTCLAGRSDAARLLIEKGASLELETGVGVRPLHIACTYGQAQLVQLLLEKGAEVEARQSKGCMAHPLHLAALCGCAEVVDVLIRHKAKPNAEDMWGWLPLHFASQEGHVDVMKQLIAANGQHLVGMPVMVDCTNDHSKLLKNLLLCKVCSHDEDLTTVCKSCYGAHTLALENLSLHTASADRPAKDGVTGLYLAAQNGHVDAVEVLLKTGSCAEAMRVDVTSPLDGYTALHASSFNGHVKVVESLIRYEVCLDACPTDVLLTALHLACMQGHKDVVDMLLRHGASADLRDNRGLSPLHLACIYNHDYLIPSLLAKVKCVYNQSKAASELLTLACKYSTADVIKNLVNWIPSITEHARESAAVHAASSEGKVDVLTILLEHNMSPNVQVYGSAPIHKAAEKGHAKAVETLLRYGASVNSVSSSSNTPLQLACKENHPEVVRVLLSEKSADLEARDRNGRTALHMAACADSADIVKMLLSVGADTNAQDSDYKTPLYETQNIDVVNTLLRSRADANIPTSRGDTPLHRVCHLGLDQIVVSLLASRANPSTRDNSGQTPLLKACQSQANVMATARLLLANNVDVNTADFQGKAPLHEACSQGHVDLVRLLLEHKAEVRKEDDGSETALHKACLSGSADVVATLVKAGAQVNQQNIDGQTPLHHACSHLHPGVVKALLDLGADKNVKNKAGLTPMEVVSSMALIPPLPPDSMQNGDSEEKLLEQENLTKARLERRREVLDHFVDSNPSSARSSTSSEMAAETATLSADPDNPKEAKKSYCTKNDSLLPPMPAKDYMRPSPMKSDRTGVSDVCVSKSDFQTRPATNNIGRHQERETLEKRAQSCLLKQSSMKEIRKVTRMHENGLLSDENKTGQSPPPVRPKRNESFHTMLDLKFPPLPPSYKHQAGERKAAKTTQEKRGGSGNKARQTLAIGQLRDTKEDDVTTLTAGHKDTHDATAEGLEVSMESCEDPRKEDEGLQETLAFLDCHYPLHAACLRGDPHAVMDHLPTADVNARNAPDDRTPLHYACLGGHNHITAVILRLGADMTAQDARGQRPLDLACVAGHLYTVHLLLAQGGPGADLQARDRFLKTVLHLAAQRGHVAITSLLLTLGADVNAVDRQGRTALHAAAAGGHVGVVATLLARGSPAGITDQSGNSPLMLAAQGTHADCCLLLMAAGADSSLPNDSGQSAHSLTATSTDPAFKALFSMSGLAARKSPDT